MSLMHVSSPHVHKPVTSVEQVMKQVLLATVPGVLALTWFFGPGTLVNIVFGSCLLYTSPSPRDATLSRMPSSA